MTEKSFTGETDLFGLQQQPKRIHDKPNSALIALFQSYVRTCEAEFLEAVKAGKLSRHVRACEGWGYQRVKPCCLSRHVRACEALLQPCCFAIALSRQVRACEAFPP